MSLPPGATKTSCGRVRGTAAAARATARRPIRPACGGNGRIESARHAAIAAAAVDGLADGGSCDSNDVRRRPRIRKMSPATAAGRLMRPDPPFGSPTRRSVPRLHQARATYPASRALIVPGSGNARIARPDACVIGPSVSGGASKGPDGPDFAGAVDDARVPWDALTASP